MQNHVHKHKLFEGVHLGLEDRELRRPSGGGLVDRAQHRGALGVYDVHERGVLAHHWRWKVHLLDGNLSVVFMFADMKPHFCLAAVPEII
jgi:hypothetical protein